jgi:hypothetical protein
MPSLSSQPRKAASPLFGAVDTSFSPNPPYSERWSMPGARTPPKTPWRTAVRFSIAAIASSRSARFLHVSLLRSCKGSRARGRSDVSAGTRHKGLRTPYLPTATQTGTERCAETA